MQTAQNILTIVFLGKYYRNVVYNINCTEGLYGPFTMYFRALKVIIRYFRAGHFTIPWRSFNCIRADPSAAICLKPSGIEAGPLASST